MPHGLQVDGLLEKFQTEKGPMSGATPLSMEFMDLTTTGLQLRNALSQAVEEERCHSLIEGKRVSPMCHR